MFRKPTLDQGSIAAFIKIINDLAETEYNVYGMTRSQITTNTRLIEKFFSLPAAINIQK